MVGETARFDELRSLIDRTPAKKRSKMARTWCGELPEGIREGWAALIERCASTLAHGSAVLVQYARLPGIDPTIRAAARSRNGKPSAVELDYLVGPLAAQTVAPIGGEVAHRTAPSAFVPHPEGGWLTGGGHGDSTLCIWASDCTCIRVIETPHHAGIGSIAVDAGRAVAFTSGTEGDARIFVWDLETGAQRRAFQVDYADFASLVFDAGTDSLVIVDGALHGWRMDDGPAPTWSVVDESNRSGAYVRFVVDSSQGLIFALRLHDGPDGTLEVRRIADGQLVRTVALDYDFSKFRGFADGELVDAGDERVLWVSRRAVAPSCLLHREDGRRIASLPLQPGTRCGTIVRSSAGEAIVLGSGRGNITAWRLPEATMVGTWVAHDGGVSLTVAIDDSRRLVTGGADGRIACWDVAAALEHPRHAAAPTDVGVIDTRSDAETELVGATVTGQLVRWTPTTGLVSAFEGSPVATGRIALASDRPWAAATVRNNWGAPRVRIVDLTEHRIVAEPIDPIDWASDLAWLEGGRLAVLVSGAGEGRVVTIEGDAAGFAAPDPARGIQWLFVAPSRRQFAVVEPQRGGDPVAVHLFDADGHHVHALAGHVGAVHDVVFTRDGRRLVSAGTDTTLRVWSVATGECERVLGRVAAPFSSFARVPAARVALAEPQGLAVSTSDEKALRVWDLESGECVGELVGHSAPPTWVVVPAHGRWAASAGPDASVRIWDLGLRVQTAAWWFETSVERLRTVGDDVLAVVTKGPRLHLLRVGSNQLPQP